MKKLKNIFILLLTLGMITPTVNAGVTSFVARHSAALALRGASSVVRNTATGLGMVASFANRNTSLRTKMNMTALAMTFVAGAVAFRKASFVHQDWCNYVEEKKNAFINKAKWTLGGLVVASIVLSPVTSFFRI